MQHLKCASPIALTAVREIGFRSTSHLSISSWETELTTSCVFWSWVESPGTLHRFHRTTTACPGSQVLEWFGIRRFGSGGHNRSQFQQGLRRSEVSTNWQSQRTGSATMYDIKMTVCTVLILQRHTRKLNSRPVQYMCVHESRWALYNWAVSVCG